MAVPRADCGAGIGVYALGWHLSYIMAAAPPLATLDPPPASVVYYPHPPRPKSTFVKLVVLPQATYWQPRGEDEECENEEHEWMCLEVWE